MKYYNIYSHSPPFVDSRRVIVVSYKQKYMHKVLVNFLFKLAQEKCVVKRTGRLDMTIAVGWDVNAQTKTKIYDEICIFF